MTAQHCYGPVNNHESLKSSLKTLALQEVVLKDGFWQHHQEVNHRVSLYHGYRMLSQNGAFNNFKLAAGLVPGEMKHGSGHDTDVYKWMEGVAWELALHPDETLLGYVMEIIPSIEAAQSPDGYLNCWMQLTHPEQKWADLNFGHEMYTAGHLIQSAIAVNRALGDDRLLKVACRFADHIASIFGPGKRPGTCGHPEVETALVELYRETGEKRYLDLAEFLVDERGQKRLSGLASYGPEYHQDHAPVREAREAVGHAVRQAYLSTGVTDLFMETGEQALFDSLSDLWLDISSSKLYITGGIGARFEGEAYGDPYELPTDQCYCETCAAIGNVMWNWRMLLVTGERRFADVIEQTIYNAILTSPALDGQHYFYVNPLMLRTSNFLRLSTNRPDSDDAQSGRPMWHGVACCPPNVMRLLPSLQHYFASSQPAGIQIHQFSSLVLDTQLEAAGHVVIESQTGYPWNGDVRLTIQQAGDATWQLEIRVPGWCEGYRLEINGQAVDLAPNARGYLAIQRQWHAGDTVTLALEMPARLVVANPRVDAIRGCVAVQRGPLVYCFESHDQPTSANLLDIQIDVDKPITAEWVEDLLGGVVVLHVPGYVEDAQAWGEQLYRPLTKSAAPAQTPVQLKAIPHYAWGNRGLKAMRIWVPRSDLNL
jgi:uncharacterized protein